MKFPQQYEAIEKQTDLLAHISSNCKYEMVGGMVKFSIFKKLLF